MKKNFFSLAIAVSSILAASCPDSPSQELGTGIESRGTFANFFHRAESGEPVHVVFLGGSITQNTKGHTAMVPAWMKEKFPDTKFTFTNAGLSSTCSVSGAFRFQDHVAAKGPVDLLIVEFAVNDDQDAAHDRKTAIRGLEGIVHQTRTHNPSADILSIHFVNPGMLETVSNGETPVSIAAHEAVAKHYGISSVNVAAALAAQVKAGSMSWKDYGGTHPKAEGYRFASDLIIEALSSNRNGEPSPHRMPETPLDPANYGKAEFADPQSAAWLGSWKFGPVGRDLLPVGSIRSDYEQYQVLRADEAGAMLYLDFRGRAIGAWILAGPDAGMVEVRIDGGEWTRHDLYHRHSKGLNYPRSVIFADDLTTGFHQLALRIGSEKNPASKGNAASILFFEVNR